VKRYRLPFGQAITHIPDQPERTARRSLSGIFDGVEFQVWPNRPSLARSVRMQERGAPSAAWRPCVPLTPGEGY
jgi:hypothetical protein